jgi:hypothetical protein
MTNPTPEYLTGRLAQIKAACDARNGELAAGIIGLIRADGYPEVADTLVRDLIGQGLRNLVGAR